MPVAVAADLQRVDRIHLVAGRHQRTHQQTRSVSVPATTPAGSSVVAGTARSRARPSIPSAMRARASTPVGVEHASRHRWRSAQSIPTNSTGCDPPLLVGGSEARADATAR